MTKKQARDRAYYEERLKRDDPAVYADLKAGKHRTVADAAIAAGLKKARTRLLELKNAWRKANRSEQHEFLKWIRGGVVTPVSASSIAIGGRLIPATCSRISDIMLKRDLKPGDLMNEMGFSRLNASLGNGMKRGWRLQPDLIAAIEKWLKDNDAI
ncbi:hypothetical protein [Rhizobium sp. Leaf386]|uniref:hypothetical protein n=1 Tax=Rhizobium sp. Leaf386 TaxID=1736359 RepID=UPI000714E331|nr:hypothetical protein [Rhizobium sp. Leaf386]KQT07002.1 hypothetical protein ASG50_00795 [Rhizobium sp. Leaf386]